MTVKCRKMRTIVLMLVLTALLSCRQKETTATNFANDTDYICGMAVRSTFTDTCTHAGKTYAFCSAGCKEEFLKNPDKYLAGQ